MKKQIAWLSIITMLMTLIALPLGSLPVRAEEGGNPLVGKSATSSSSNGAYTSEHIFDGNQDTYWESSGNLFPQWIHVELGSSVSINQVVIKLPTVWETRTQTFSIQGSMDGSDFYELAGSTTYEFNPAFNNTVTVNFNGENTRYVRLNITANTGWSAAQISELEVYGEAAEVIATIPGNIEAEQWTAMNGIHTEATTDIGGGLHVGWIHVDDWLDYNVNVQSAGTYTVQFRVASEMSTGELQLRSGTTVLTTISVPDTGGWQNWQTISTNVTLSAGEQTLRLYASGYDFNINWINFIPASVDSLAPTSPTNITFTQSNLDTIHLTWDASNDNVGVTSYEIFVNNQYYATVDGNTLFYIDQRPADVTLTYYILAKDAAGNSSAPSQTVTRVGSSRNDTNLSLYSQITASSEIFNFSAANINDDDVTTYWEGNGYPSVLHVDLNGTAHITSIVLKLDPSTNWEARTQTIQLLGREQNSSTFTSLLAPTQFTFDPVSQNTVTISVEATVSNIQVHFTTNSGSQSGQVAELQIWGTSLPKPDLIVSDMTWSPATPDESDSILINTIVQNVGTVAASASDVGIYVGNIHVGTASVPVLSAGASALVSVDAGVQSAGSYELSAKVDQFNVIFEENEGNNSYTHSNPLVVSPVASSDLVGSVSWTPDHPLVDSAVTFSVKLTNKGIVDTASGSHGISLIIKNAANDTIKTFHGSYDGVLLAGASTNVNIPGSWIAAGGSYTVHVEVEADSNEIEAKQVNNEATVNLAVYAARGASLPYTRYDTEDASYGGGAFVNTALTFNQDLIASEASGQAYVALPSTGSYLEWTVREGEGGSGVTMRFTMPDSPDGMGVDGSLDVYVNGVIAKTVPLTSYYSWQYFSSDHPSDVPNGGRPLFRFDEVHWKLDTPLEPGDTIRVQRADDHVEYGVDFIEIEPVPAAISRPENSISVTDFGAIANDGQDDLAAFEAAVNEAVASGKALYIPEGTFHLDDMWVIGSPTNMIDDLTVVGSGIWHTNLKFTNANAASGGISFRIAGQLDFSHVYMNSNLRSRYNQEAVYKGFMDNFGINSKVHNVWVEHFECGFWVGDYAHTPAIIAEGLVIENSRIRNNLADGINFAQGTSYSTVRNSSLRNNGDDALAVWTSNVNGAPAGINNTFTYNTIENNWRAAAIAFFGGGGHKATHNLIIDTVGGSGIRMNTVFPGYHFQNNTGILISDTTIIRSGTSQDLYNGERGAIDLEASSNPIQNVTFNNIDIIDAQRDAIQFGYSGGFVNVEFNNVTIDGAGLDGITTSRFSGQHLGSAIYS
ncbi:MAG TPA: carbohydrate-binding protein, partial [Candidatus Paenibacillus intestinavium]|nr:carbohydrate-binding protein [Candidatus Paenibacillus intestinavium]